MALVQEEAHSVHDQIEWDWWSNQICAGLADFGWMRAGQLQPHRNGPRQIPSKLQEVHQCSNPHRFPPESPSRSEKVEERLSGETKRHTGARLYRPRDWDQQLSWRIPASHCRQECHQATGQQTIGPTRIWNPNQVAAVNAGSEF